MYSGWCGPCKAVQGLFRRVKNELGDDLLKFAVVCVAEIFVMSAASNIAFVCHDICLFSGAGKVG